MLKFCTFIVLAAAAGFSAPVLGEVQVIMSGLDNPRGLALGPDGGIYVAEAGHGGKGTEIIGGEGLAVQFGDSGAVSRFLNGTQQRVVTNLPSLAPQTGASALRGTGLHDIAFRGTDLFGVIGLGTDPAKRALLAADSTSFAHLVRLPMAGAPQNLADIGTFETNFNPDGAARDSNAYGLLPTAAGFEVTDAGANALFSITTAGAISTHSVFAPRTNPLPFGPPTFQAVPTTVARGPDAALYVGELTGFPFPPGAANVYRIDPITGSPSVDEPGFTNIIDLAFGPDGDMFVLQITSNGLASPQGPGAGKLIRIDAETLTRTTMLDSPLFFPGGLLITPDYSIYVSNLGTSPAGGQVLQVIPEPGALSALAIVGLMLRRRPRHSADDQQKPRP